MHILIFNSASSVSLLKLSGNEDKQFPCNIKVFNFVKFPKSSGNSSDNTSKMETY